MNALFVGLGNPGANFENSKHNIGFKVAGELIRRYRLQETISDSTTRLFTGVAGVLLPQTFMNDSGIAVVSACQQLDIPLDHVVVIHDEIDLPFGEIRRKYSGDTLGGHNGLKSIKRETGSTDFWRVRVGVGRPETTDGTVIAAYALSSFYESDQRVQELIDNAASVTERIALEELN